MKEVITKLFGEKHWKDSQSLKPHKAELILCIVMAGISIGLMILAI